MNSALSNTGINKKTIALIKTSLFLFHMRNFRYKKVNYILFFIFFICQFRVYSIDSLQLNLKQQQLEMAPDTQKLRLYKELSWEYRYIDIKKAEAFAVEGIELAGLLGDSANYYNLYRNLGIIFALQSKYESSIEHLSFVVQYFQRNDDKEETAKALNQLGAVQTAFGDFNKADSLLLCSVAIYEQIADDKGLVLALMDRGANFRRWKKLDETKRIYTKGLELSQKMGDAKNAAKFKMGLGMVEVRRDNYLPALDYYLQASEGDYDDELFKSKIYNNLGNLYDRLDELDKALEYHQKSLEIKRKLGLERIIANSLNNIGLTYKKLQNYGDALRCFEEVLEMRKKMEGTNNNLGGTYCNIGTVLLDLKRYAEAEVNFKQCLKISEDIKDEYDRTVALSNLATTYKETRQYQMGLNYGHQSLELAEQLNFSRLAQSSAEVLSECYKGLGRFKEAYEYNNKFWVIRDSVSGAEVTSKIASLETKYEREKKDSELKLEKEQVENLINQGKIDRLKISLLALACLLFALISGWLFFSFQKRKKNFIQEKTLAEQEVADIREEKTVLEEKIFKQQVQLDDYIKQLLVNSERLLAFNKQSNPLIEEKNEYESSSNMNDLLKQNLQSENGQKKFEHLFTLVHKDFFKTLNRAFPNLSTYDLNLCALIKLNLINKEIAQIIGISPTSVKKARQRLYQKMNLADNDALRNYIIQV